jgi:hypothetical protein
MPPGLCSSSTEDVDDDFVIFPKSPESETQRRESMEQQRGAYYQDDPGLKNLNTTVSMSIALGEQLELPKMNVQLKSSSQRLVYYRCHYN